MTLSSVGQGTILETPTRPESAATSTAHLVIHADGDLATWRTQMRTNFWRLAVLLNTKNRSSRHRPFNVQIQDLHGLMIEEVNNAKSLIDLQLLPGTYHVKAQIGRIQRCFTLSLKKDARFDLFLYRDAEFTAAASNTSSQNFKPLK